LEGKEEPRLSHIATGEIIEDGKKAAVVALGRTGSKARAAG
jgi:hypothetical protein